MRTPIPQTNCKTGAISPGFPANIDTDATDDFSGSWNDLTDIPPGFADGVDNTADGSGDGYAQGGTLNIANERIDIDMADPAGDFLIDLSSIENLPSFSGWDKDATDDFSGAWGDLTGIPAGFADNTDNVEDADKIPQTSCKTGATSQGSRPTSTRTPRMTSPAHGVT
jgi:hypothetical protein